MSDKPSPQAAVYKEQVKDAYLYWRDLYVRTRGMSDEQVLAVIEEQVKGKKVEW